MPRKDTEHKKLVDNLEVELHYVRGSEASIKALLEAAEAQLRQEREKVANLESQNQALEGMVQLEMKRSEEARQEKEQADEMLEVTFDEAIYMAWLQDKNMNLLLYPDPATKRAEFKAKEKADAALLAGDKQGENTLDSQIKTKPRLGPLYFS